ncbi:MAG: single-stranded-DNA-specific exonuclease RecJ, partial [Candidatus Omnitrophota bacterium]
RTPQSARNFLFGELSSCYDPFLMKDMDRGTARIKQAVASGEKILIYGDYDVDGVTSTALLSDIFETMGAKYETFIPNRMEDGYGLNIRAVAMARDRGVKLIVTVDCGINSVEEVKCAADYGIDVVITDHHEVKSGERPPAFAIIDPHQEECGYPFKYLAGVGVTYKIAQALLAGTGARDYADRHLDLVALGTVADVVPQIDENRILTKAGLKKLRCTEKPGLNALMRVAGIDPENLTCRHIGFGMGPRINAMGRVGSANVALDLLMCRDAGRASEIANILDRENRNRQDIEKDILKDVQNKINRDTRLKDQEIIVLGDEKWHPGIIGIVASRITEEYSKPAILISFDGEMGKGSGRSVKGFNLFNAINEANSYLVDFGGHEQACGIRIKKENLESFRGCINEAAKKNMPSGKIPELNIDIELPFAHMNMNLIKEMELLMPYGPGNFEPVFSTNGLKVKSAPRNIGKNGFKFFATCGNITREAITFRKNGSIRPSAGNTINLAYTPSINSWGGIDTIQLNIKDMQIAPQ